MPRIIDHQARRRQIFEGSIELFSQHGFAGLGMRQLAHSLDVSTGTLYHYFPNKIALFEGMLRHFATDDVAMAISVVRAIDDVDQRFALIRRFIASQFDRIRQVLLVAIDYRREMGEEGEALVREVLTVYQDAIADQLTNGDKARAASVVSFVIGVLVHTGLFHPSGNVETLLLPMDRLAKPSV
jgi:AcrR family transcriptional regulator